LKITIKESDLHPHIKARMVQRGISWEEIQTTINEGWNVEDAKEGTMGKIFVFSYNGNWEGKYFEEKEVSVYFKYKAEAIVLLTAKARYGQNFSKKRG
jgi:hypothetical protein